MDKRKKKNEKWRKWHHTLVKNIASALLYPYAKLKYGITIRKFREETRRPYLILYNHQTAFDQFFLGMTFREHLYYVASEDLFSNGLVSRLIRTLVAPIPIKKQATDIGAIKNCLKVAREGGSIAIAPEGNRTYSGKTEYMRPSIAPLARRLGLPILLYRIEGGYGVHPRWSDVVRKGRMRGYVSRVIEPEEYASLSDDALFSLIEKELFVSECPSADTFCHRKRAEYIERFLYVCPSCGLSSFHSDGDRFRCLSCGRAVVYEPNLTLRGVDCVSPFPTLTAWYDYQKDFVSKLDLSDTRSPLYVDEVRLTHVIMEKRKETLRKKTTLSLYGDRITFDEGAENAMTLPFREIRAMAVLGKNKLNVYHGQTLYQVKGDKRFNAIKYVNIYFHHKNITQGEPYGKFWGL